MLDLRENKSRPAASARFHRWQEFALLVVLLVFWLWAGAMVGRGSLGHNSDVVNPFLRASDMLHGNWALSGWCGPQDNFYTLDDSLSLICLSLFGFNYGTLILQSFITFICIMTGAVYLAKSPGASRLVCSMVLFLCMGLTSYTQLFLISAMNCHVLTIAGCLLCFVLVDRLGEPGLRTRHIGAWAAFAMATFLLTAGDPFFLYVGLLPLLAITGRDAISSRQWRFFLEILCSSLLAVLAAKMLVGVLRSQGYLILDSDPISKMFADRGRIRVNLRTYFESFWIILGPGDGNLLWLSSPGPGLAWLGRLFLSLRIILITLAVGWTAKLFFWQRKSPRPDSSFIDAVLLAGIAANSGAYIFSTMPALDTSSDRYLAPAAVYAAILTARRFGSVFSAFLAARKPRLRGVVLTAFFAMLAIFIPEILKASRGQPDAAVFKLVDYLESQGLKSGFGGYWQSSIVTVLSGQKVSVLGVAEDSIGKMAPFYWLCNRFHYDAPANFLVYDDNDTSPIKSDQAQILKTFGPPARTGQAGSFHILIWDHDIQPWLDRPGYYHYPLDVLRQGGLCRIAGVTVNADGSIVDAQPRLKDRIVIFGPYLPLPAGRYRVTFSLAETGAIPDDFAVCDVATHLGNEILAKEQLPGLKIGPPTAPTSYALTFESTGLQDEFEFRVAKKGGMQLTLTALTLEKL